MSLESELETALLDGYQRAGEEVGYWGRRFLQAVRRSGGLATVKRMLKPRNAGQRAGLDKLLDAGRPDLTVEAIVLRPQFESLFSDAERSEARTRLGSFQQEAELRRRESDPIYPDDLPLGVKYVEGAKKTVRVNAYERDPRARKACLEHHGHGCIVCALSFEAVYGERGKDFIHVHHIRPLATLDGAYRVDPVFDLVPVCPNCHAMLHRGREVLSIIDLRARLRRTG
jgi:5-methylcytosine-specific restriction protein A